MEPSAGGNRERGAYANTAPFGNFLFPRSLDATETIENVSFSREYDTASLQGVRAPRRNGLPYPNGRFEP